MTDQTHDPRTQSWVAHTNDAEADFPLQNLPLGVVDSHVVIAIGKQVLDVPAGLDAGLFHVLPSEVKSALRQPRLNDLFALGRGALGALRHASFLLLREDSAEAATAATCLRKIQDIKFDLPCEIGDYTDFFASYNHAQNTFNLFRPGQEFLPNFEHLPIAYHGRSSSIAVSGRPVSRPQGQVRTNPQAAPLFGPTRKLDFEVELGFYVGTGNALGSPISIANADQHIAGFSILNDWSARDVQAFESQPLGPFLSKNFFSSVSPWVVTLDALEPFRTNGAPRNPGAPPLQNYLQAIGTQPSAFDIRIETWLQSPTMRKDGLAPAKISAARFARDSYWTPAQMLAHHSIGGCNMRPGDLVGSGTLSGDHQGSEGSLIEMTWGGSRPLTLPNGETRTFLEDGDEVTLQAWCEKPGFRRIGLGQCVTRVLPSNESTP